MPLHESKKVQLQELFWLMTHDFIDHLKTLWAEHFIAEPWRWVWMEMLQLIAQGWKNTNVF